MEKAAKLQRLLRFGKSKVQIVPLPSTGGPLPTFWSDVTYVFMDDSSKLLASSLHQQGLLCVSYRYLFEYLIQEIEPDVFQFIVQEDTTANFDAPDFFNNSNTNLSYCTPMSVLHSEASGSSSKLFIRPSQGLGVHSMSDFNIEQNLRQDHKETMGPVKRKLDEASPVKQSLNKAPRSEAVSSVMKRNDDVNSHLKIQDDNEEDTCGLESDRPNSTFDGHSFPHGSRKELSFPVEKEKALPEDPQLPITERQIASGLPSLRPNPHLYGLPREEEVPSLQEKTLSLKSRSISGEESSDEDWETVIASIYELCSDNPGGSEMKLGVLESTEKESMRKNGGNGRKSSTKFTATAAPEPASVSSRKVEASVGESEILPCPTAESNDAEINRRNSSSFIAGRAQTNQTTTQGSKSVNFSLDNLSGKPLSNSLSKGNPGRDGARPNLDVVSSSTLHRNSPSKAGSQAFTPSKKAQSSLFSFGFSIPRKGSSSEPLSASSSLSTPAYKSEEGLEPTPAVPSFGVNDDPGETSNYNWGRREGRHGRTHQHSEAAELQQAAGPDFLPALTYPSLNPNTVTVSHSNQPVSNVVEKVVEAAIETGHKDLAFALCRMRSDQPPNAGLIKQLVTLARSEDAQVVSKACAYLKTWLDLHPPVSLEQTFVYMEGLLLFGDECLLVELIRNCNDSDSTVDLIEVIIHALELNFKAVLASGENRRLRSMMAVQTFWGRELYQLPCNWRVRLLVSWLEDVLGKPQVNVRALRAVMALLHLVCHCMHFASTGWNLSTPVNPRNDHLMSLAQDCAKVVRLKERESIMLVFHLLRPAWLRTLVSAAILSFYSHYFVSEKPNPGNISLHDIVTKYFFLVPPISNDERKPQEAEHKSKSRTVWCNPNKRNMRGESPLHVAAIKNNHKEMRLLLSIPGVDVNLADNLKWTPLHEACNHNSYECVELLLKFVPSFERRDVSSDKVDLLAKGGDDHITPLHDAVNNGHMKICKLLLKFGGSRLLAATDKRGITPLQYARTEDELASLLDMARAADTEVGSSSSSLRGSNEVPNSDLRGSPRSQLYELVFGENSQRVPLQNCSLFLSYLSVLIASYMEWKGLPSTSHLFPQDAAIAANFPKHFEELIEHLRNITSPESFKALRMEIAFAKLGFPPMA